MLVLCVFRLGVFGDVIIESSDMLTTQTWSQAQLHIQDFIKHHALSLLQQFYRQFNLH